MLWIVTFAQAVWQDYLSLAGEALLRKPIDRCYIPRARQTLDMAGSLWALAI